MSHEKVYIPSRFLSTRILLLYAKKNKRLKNALAELN